MIRRLTLHVLRLREGTWVRLICMIDYANRKEYPGCFQRLAVKWMYLLNREKIPTTCVTLLLKCKHHFFLNKDRFLGGEE